MKKTVRSVLFLLLLSGLAAAQEGGVTDEDYRFRISPPGAGWRVLDETQVKRVLPDAVAGGMHDKGFFGVVIAEAAPGVDLEAMARMILDNMPLEMCTLLRPLRSQHQYWASTIRSVIG